MSRTAPSWLRTLLLIAVALGGMAGLRASLFPLCDRRRAVDLSPRSPNNIATVVGRVDAAFAATHSVLPAADDLTIARRLALGLAGTIPSLEEIRRFEASPPESRLDGWVGYLLRDRRTADYLAERLSRAFVGTEDGPLVAYRKRRFKAWLSDELLANRRYDELVREMIAGRGLNTDRPGVNFIAAAYDEERGGPDPEKLAIRVSRAFLGLRLDCAQCHDHFLEPRWKQSHFQSLAAYFGQTRQIVTNVTDGDGDYSYDNRTTGEKVHADPGVPYRPDLLPAEGTLRERLAAWVTHPEHAQFARATVNRIWTQLVRRPLTDRVESQTLPTEVPAALAILADDFVAHEFDVHRLIRIIAATAAFRQQAAGAIDGPGFPVSPLRPEQVAGALAQAASVRTINQHAHIVTRLARYADERQFVERYGDPGDDDLNPLGTIPQRLLLLNGDLVDEKAREELFNASTQIGFAAADDRAAVEAAFLTVLTRRPTPAESDHFVARLAEVSGDDRRGRLADLFWALFNSAEFSWNR